MAERVALSQSSCWKRLRRMEDAGVVRKYVALLDNEKLGLPDIVFIEIILDKHNDTILSDFGTAIEGMPEVLEAHLVTGEYDYIIKVAVAGTAHYERFLRERLYKVKGLRHSRSTFALRSLKYEVSADPNTRP